MELLDARFKKRIKIQGHRSTRTLTCPYCRKIQKVTLVSHLKKEHPKEWNGWVNEFIRLYNETNDLKRVMREFSNSDGYLILSWSVIDREIKRKTSKKGMPLRFNPKSKISRWEPSSDEYKQFRETVWHMPTRGTWGVHQSTYRGNCAPQVPRALIELYTKPGDLILDPFMGGATALLEAWSLGRNAIGYDISDAALAMARSRLRELEKKAAGQSLYGLPNVRIDARRGDARVLPAMEKSSTDFIFAHPPYWNAVQYTHDHPSDLSRLSNWEEFLHAMTIAGRRFYEVLKPGGFCAILVGDVRRQGTLHPLGFEVFSRYLGIGFHVQDIIVKTQNKERSTEFWFKDQSLRLRLNHEYIFVLRKDCDGNDT